MNPRQIETRRMIYLLIALLLTMELILEIWQIARAKEENRPLKDYRWRLGPRLLLRFRPTGRCSQPVTEQKKNNKHEASADPLGSRL